jgi:hypothetical protein
MNGTIFSTVMLARAVRGCLRKVPADTVATDVVVAPYAHAVRFVDVDAEQQMRRTVLAVDVAAWVAQVVAAGATDAWVRHGRADRPEAPDRVLAAFVNGGGLWSVVVSGPRGTDAWIVQSRFDPRADRDPRPWWGRWWPFGPKRVERPWEVSFIRVPMAPHAVPGPAPDVGRCTARLGRALDDNRDFAVRWKLESWATFFAAARAALDGAPPSGADLPDFAAPDVFGAAANRLLVAAGMSWCFGGMGTWNDIIVSDDAEQERQFALATELYDAVVEAVEQATWPAT